MRLEKYNEIITVDELMEILHISRNTAYNLLRNGEIYAFKINTVWKIPKDALNEYIDWMLGQEY